MDARIGQRIGDYKLVRLLGTGSFGKVYYAERAKTEQPAAVKLFHAELTPEKLKDFLNEAQTVFLVHPNIVKFFGFNVTSDKIPYIIMEYAPQGSLRQRHLYGKPLSLNAVIAYVKPIVAGLQYAHNQGRVHRDIKPENILVSADGEIWVGDFGISVVAHSTSSQGTEDSRGTAPYMAPEHWRGKATNASDQYSLGIMVYEWLCGHYPFEGSQMELMHYHLFDDPPSLRDRVPDISPAVEQVVLKALAKKPADRFERVETFAIALERAARGEALPPVVTLPPSSKYTNVLLQTPPNSIEQLFQEGVRAQANGDVEEAFRVWQQVVTMPGVAEKYSTAARNRIQELRTQMIALRLKQARAASTQGRWQEEIRRWEDLLELKPSEQELAALLTLPLTPDKPTNEPIQSIQKRPRIARQNEQNELVQSIQKRLQIARQNEQSAWMYASAQQLIQSRDRAAVCTQLQMLWRDAPYYGDPAGLAQTVGLPASLNYEQIIAAEQLERELLAQKQALEAQEQERLKRELAKKQRKDSIYSFILVVVIVIGIIAGIIIGVQLGAGTVEGTIVGVVGGAVVGAVAGAVVGIGIAIFFPW